MRIIALEREREGATAGRYRILAASEARKVWELQQAEFIREAHFRRDMNSAVLILEADSEKAAAERLNELPFVRENLIEFELIPLRPYPGFERLFTDENPV
jgi:hypothetical protein